MNHAELEHNLTNHPPTADAAERMELLRKYAKVFGAGILDLCPDSREKSLAITHLEQTVMWAVASVARATDGAQS